MKILKVLLFILFVELFLCGCRIAFSNSQNTANNSSQFQTENQLIEESIKFYLQAIKFKDKEKIKEIAARTPNFYWQCNHITESVVNTVILDNHSTSSDYQSQGDESAYNTVIENFPNFMFGVKRPTKFSDNAINGDFGRVKVQYELEKQNGGSFETERTFYLVKSIGRWKIFYVGTHTDELNSFPFLHFEKSN